MKECKKDDPLWTSSLHSKLILQDASWPYLKWDHSKKILDLDGKSSSIPMKNMISNLEQLYKMMERSQAIIRFHALQSKSKQAPVIPWRLELDMKDHRLHAMMAALVHSSVWQLIQVRLKPHHLQQSKMADELMKHKEEVDRKGLRLALSTTHLVNDEVQCFANAVYLTVMRTHLMCSAFTMGSWGLVTTTFLTTLMDGKRSPLCLRSHPMLQSGFAQWQQLRGERANVQQDYSEFLQYFLGWVSSTHVAQTISRRFSRADEVVTEAKSA